MKNIIVLLSICIFLSATLKAQGNNAEEKEALKKVIVDSYVNGVFNKGDATAIKKGWYYDCDIVIFQKGVWGSILKIPAYFFVERFEKEPGPHKTGTTYEFTYVHVVGYAGIAIVEIFQERKHIYTDFLNLYKFDDGWKIVTKTYYAYPKDS